MKAAFYIILLEPGFVENGVVRQEIDGGSGLPCPSFHGQKSVFQRNHRIASFVFVLINKATGFDRYGQSGGKGIDY